MKRKFFILSILAFAFFCTPGYAQVKEHMLGEDGFEWYKITKTISGKKKYGAQDRNGNTIVPAEYDGVIYDVGCYTCVDYSPVVAGFNVRKGKFRGWYNKSGKCIIPYSRGYNYIRKYDNKWYGTHYAFTKNGGGGICDRNGKEIVSVKIDNLKHIEISSTFEGTELYYLLFFDDNNLCGIADANGNIVVTPEFEYNGHQKELKHLISTRVTTTNNPLSGNTRETLAEAGGQQSNNKFDSVEELKNGNTKYYKVSKGGRCGLIGPNDKEIVPCEMEALETAGTGYLKYKINGFWGVMNYAGKIIIDTDRGYTSIGNFVTFTKRFPYTMSGYKGECDATGRQISKIKIDTPQPSVAKQETTTSKKEGDKETIIIKHEHDPIPMQVWLQCTGCYGSGMCQSGCNGTGWYTGYGGNSTRCIGCGGSGRCQFCAGKGGHYEVQYK